MEGIQYQNQNHKKKLFTSNWRTGENRIPLLTHVCACINAPPQPLQLASYCQRLGPMYLQYSSRQWIQGILGIEGWWVWWRYVALRYMVLLGSVQRKSCVKPQIFKLERWLIYLQGSQIGDRKGRLDKTSPKFGKTDVPFCAMAKHGVWEIPQSESCGLPGLALTRLLLRPGLEH